WSRTTSPGCRVAANACASANVSSSERVTANHQPPTCHQACAASLHPVVRRFLGGGHVVHVALAHAGRRTANQPGLALPPGDVGAAAVAHAGAQAADELVDDRRRRTLVRDPPLNPFGYQLVGRPASFQIELVLEVAVAAAAAHGANRPHAAVLLVAAPLEQD